MSGAYVQSAVISTAQTSATSTATGAITQAGGNLNIYLAFYDGSGAGGAEPTITPNDTLSNAYTKVQSIWDATNLLKAEWGIAKNIGAGSNALTITYGGTLASSYFKAAALYEWSGLSTSAPFIAGEFNGQEQANTGVVANSLNSGNTGSLTSQPALIIGFSTIAHNTNGAPTVGTSPLAFTANGPSFWDFATGTPFAQVGSARVTATGAYAATFNPTATANFFTMVMALHESAGIIAPSAGGLSLSGGASSLNAGITPHTALPHRGILVPKRKIILPVYNRYRPELRV